jgi:hypothetical protein
MTTTVEIPNPTKISSTNDQRGAQPEQNQAYYTPEATTTTRSPTSSSSERDWHDKAGKPLVNENNGWWNKEKKEGGTVRDYETKPNTEQDTSW